MHHIFIHLQGVVTAYHDPVSISSRDICIPNLVLTAAYTHVSNQLNVFLCQGVRDSVLQQKLASE
jgi:hypothetical protein